MPTTDSIITNEVWRLIPISATAKKKCRSTYIISSKGRVANVTSNPGFCLSMDGERFFFTFRELFKSTFPNFFDDSDEVWRPCEIEPFSAQYMLSSKGRIARLLATPMWQSTRYPFANLYGNRPHLVHKLVALTFIGPRPPGMVIHHKDDNRGNPAADNLQYVTQSRNVLLAYESGARQVHRQEKLLPHQVIAIRSMRDLTRVGRSGPSPKGVEVITYRKLAEAFHVSIGTISNVLIGNSYSYL